MASQIRILGEPALVDSDGQQQLRGRGQLSLLVMLALSRGRALSAERLADQLWPPTHAAWGPKALQMAMSRLRRSLDSAGLALETVPGGYRLRLPDDVLDAERFERALDRGRSAWAKHQADATLTACTAGLDEWRGPALGSFCGEPWAVAEAQRLEELRLQAQELAFEARLARGGSDEVVADLRVWVDRHPERERLVQLLTLALYRLGRQAEALAAYRHHRTLMVEELGLDPAPDLAELELAILRQDPALVGGTHSPLRANLPAAVDRLVGRVVEIEEVRRLCDEHRLVTLTGPGGTGKTRLAIEAARDAIGFDGGVRLVEFADVRDPEQLVPTIATALGAPGAGRDELLQLLARCIGSGRALLVLDNLEQLAAAGPDLAWLLHSLEGLHILATSRTALRLRGEWLYHVGPLAVPAAEADPAEVAETDAAQLFLDRAGAFDSRWQPDVDELLALGRLCRMLDGLPLAIELAAGLARVGALPTVADGSMALLPLLDGGPRDLPPRQRSLRATIAWSRNLLPAAHRQLFDQLGCFAGGWTLDGAAAVSGVNANEVESMLGDLVSRSLVMRTSATDPRFGMLETVREFAEEQLDLLPDGALVRRRHAQYVAAFMTGPAMRDGDAGWRDRLLAEQPNLRRALEWSLERDPPMALGLAARCTDFWDDAGLRSDGLRLLRASLERCPEPSLTRAAALAEAGVLSVGEGDYEEALRLFEAAQALYRALDDRGRATATLIPISGAYAQRNDFERAGAAARHAMRAMTDAGNFDAATLARIHLAESSWLGGNAKTAVRTARRALLEAGRLGQQIYQLMGRLVLSAALLASGELEEAILESRRVLDATVSRGYAKYRSLQAATQSRIELDLGELGGADRWGREAVRLCAETSDRWTGAIALEALAEAAVALGDHGRAAYALGAAMRMRRDLGVAVQPPFADRVARARAALRDALGPSELDRRLSAGGQMSLGAAATGLAAD